MEFRTTKITNGATFISYQFPSKSFAMCIGIPCGSAHEPRNKSGLAHLTEHLLFKDRVTESKKKRIAGLEATGGRIGACTNRDYTFVEAAVPSRHASICIDTLTYLLSEPRSSEDGFTNERKIVIGEIGRYLDDPQEYTKEELAPMSIFSGQFGRSLLGSRKTVRGFNEQDVVSFWRSAYNPVNFCFVAVGDFDYDSIREDIDEGVRRVSRNNGFSTRPVKASPIVSMRELALEMIGVEQAHLYYAIPIPINGVSGVGSEAGAFVLDKYIADGFSSDLHNRIREENGLCYDIISEVAGGPGYGYFGIYTNPARRDVGKVLKLTRKSFEEAQRMSRRKFETSKMASLGTIEMESEKEESAELACSLFQEYMASGDAERYLHMADFIKEVTLDQVRDLVRTPYEAITSLVPA